mgnify:CR=1 FL=1
MAPKSKQPQKPERPHLHRFFHSDRPQWLSLEPARLALVGGSLCATLTLVVYVIRQYFGTPMDPFSVLFGVTLTFFVSYAATGILVWYLLWVAEREIPREEESPRKPEQGEEPAAEIPPMEAAPAENEATTEETP